MTSKNTTTNYDSISESSFDLIYGGIRLGEKFESKDYNIAKACPVLLKLHGSFNWEVKNLELKKSHPEKARITNAIARKAKIFVFMLEFVNLIFVLS